MELKGKLLLFQLLFLQRSGVLMFSAWSDPGSLDSIVVSESNVSGLVGAQAVLPCHSVRMVWTQDRLQDRQRVLHWDLEGDPEPSPGPDSDPRARARPRPRPHTERLCDLYSAGDLRIYQDFNNGRIRLSPTAFEEGNFSLLIQDVDKRDQGVYSCNLHHHYCHLYVTVKIRLEVTDDPRESGAYWDGEREVVVAGRGRAALLPCLNGAPVWTERSSEEAQQVAHWDRQPPGVPHHRADRLLDLYASGERRFYGPGPLRRRLALAPDAFARGDFSLTIRGLGPQDRGLYSCHLHHHYCGLHERRLFRVAVAAPDDRPEKAGAPDKDPTQTHGHNVINVIVPEGRAQFFQQLGYVLATLLLFLLLLIAVLLATRQHRRRGHEYNLKKSEGQDVNLKEYAVDPGDLARSRSEDIQLDFKNNILKEQAEQAKNFSAKNVDLDKEFRKEYCK
ncbi:matrix remodeling-associated protein 8 [Tachyglossus aculeatus]|uniref:matrix remodeling-associated protein 8 n=1 Tax=Tachyglossus aculeatus TaxID=9261 RepID=UPI0018F6F174|nr:matrix remodeling-associated protein 8 [Tachyglossus aculeatus]